MKMASELRSFFAAGGVVWTFERISADARIHELFSYRPGAHPLAGDPGEIAETTEGMEQNGLVFRSEIVERHDGRERLIQWRRAPRRNRT